MNRLLEDISNDADQYSISCVRTDASSDTVVGLNSVSGRAIMRVGMVIVDGIENMYVGSRLRAIGNALQKKPEHLPLQDVRDMVELQRLCYNAT